MKFKDFRMYISKTDRLSICIYEAGEYTNYQSVREVPDSYDDLYFIGIGRVRSEFPLSVVHELWDESVRRMSDEEREKTTVFADCLEILLSQYSKDSIFKDEGVMSEQQLKDYLADIIIELERYEDGCSDYSSSEAVSTIARLAQMLYDVTKVYQNNKSQGWFVKKKDGKVFTYLVNFKDITDRIGALTDLLYDKAHE